MSNKLVRYLIYAYNKIVNGRCLFMRYSEQKNVLWGYWGFYQNSKQNTKQTNKQKQLYFFRRKNVVQNLIRFTQL